MIEHTCHVLRSRLDHTSETNDRIERNEPYQTLDYPSFLTLRTVARQWSRHELEWRADRFYFHLYPSILILLEIFIHSKRIISDIFSGFGYKPLQYVYSSLDQRKILLSSYDVTKGWRKMRNSLCKSCHSDNINNIFLDQDLF